MSLHNNFNKEIPFKSHQLFSCCERSKETFVVVVEEKFVVYVEFYAIKQVAH